jgi:hypothetical protein
VIIYDLTVERILILENTAHFIGKPNCTKQDLSLWERSAREARRVRVEVKANLETLTLPSPREGEGDGPHEY